MLLATHNLLWYLLPLTLAISLVYSASRHEQWDEILTEAFRWGIRMFGFMLIVGGVLFAVSFVI